MKDYQKILFPYAYNILGSSEDAKDAIQEVLSNYLSAQKGGIENEKSYLIKSVINQSINIRNKRKRITREGEVWLPEPFATEEADTNINLSDIVSYSMLVLLEQLNPKERAVFILKEGFGYSHEEIADVLSGTVEGSRKLLSRAKSKLSESQQPARPTQGETLSVEFLEKYVNAIRERDTQTLENILSEDIAYYADGGNVIRVVKKICTGLHEVVDLLFFVDQKFQSTYSAVPAEINHQPALLYYEGATLKSCQVMEIREGKIVRINTVLDPEKLKGIVYHRH
jgi:RNA polymerase sigma-70 factor (ECF subfamily)